MPGSFCVQGDQGCRWASYGLLWKDGAILNNVRGRNIVSVIEKGTNVVERWDNW